MRSHFPPLKYQTPNCPQTYTPTVTETYIPELLTTDSEEKALEELADENEVRSWWELWDTAGSEELDRLRPFSYDGAQVMMICFSVVDPWSFANVEEKWIPEIKFFGPNLPILLVGTKSDLRKDPEILESLSRLGQKPVTTREALTVAHRINAYKYVECSAKTGHNILQVFDASEPDYEKALEQEDAQSERSGKSAEGDSISTGGSSGDESSGDDGERRTPTRDRPSGQKVKVKAGVGASTEAEGGDDGEEGVGGLAGATTSQSNTGDVEAMIALAAARRALDEQKAAEDFRSQQRAALEAMMSSSSSSSRPDTRPSDGGTGAKKSKKRIKRRTYDGEFVLVEEDWRSSMDSSIMSTSTDASDTTITTTTTDTSGDVDYDDDIGVDE
ncbi:GTP-binding protein Rho1, partial [Quaeritorhiza haematococci]